MEASALRAALDDGGNVCDSVPAPTLAPGYLAGPAEVTEQFPGSLTFAATAGSPGLVVVQNGDGHGGGEAASATVSFNGVAVLTLAAGTPLAVAMVTFAAANSVSVSASGPGSVHVSVADLALPPCSIIDLTVTRQTGPPVTLSRTFAARQGASAVLVVVNNLGSRPGSDGVTGTVTLNGALLVGHGAFHPGSDPVAMVVPLSAANTLEVIAQGPPRAVARVLLLDPDLLLPTVTLALPLGGSVSATSPVAASGTASADAVSVEVQGIPATLVNGAFTASVPLTVGQNAVVATARDSCGNVATDCRAVALDVTPPVIALAGVAEGEVTSRDVTLTWSVTDEHPGSDAATLDAAPFASGGVVSIEGDHVLVVTAEDRGGLSATATLSFVIDRTPPELALTGITDGTCYAAPVTPAFTATDLHLAFVTATLDGAPFEPGASVATDGPHTLEVTAADTAGNASTDQRSFTVDLAGGCGAAELPPDPSTVSPPVDPTVATSLFTATEFLWSGASPIQTGVAAGTIEPRRASILRGKVLDAGGAALPGVRIEVLGHPEYGSTRTRADGAFDLAVSGGGSLTVRYTKAGLLEAHRQADVPWATWVWLPDVVMIALDPQVTALDLGAGGVQVARGSAVTDADGSRQATLLVKPGTTAAMVLPDGTLVPLQTMHLRLTEYTVGELGEAAMPAELPATSAYTYAVELSTDEALAAGATEVRLGQPASLYVENFLGFPVGGAVPTGFYDRVCGCWVPSDDGRVIQLLGSSGGLAELDVDGDGAADGVAALALLGLDAAERERLAGLYPVGTSLWRVPIPHFSPADLNWPPADLTFPDEDRPPQENEPEDEDDCKEGSILGCQSQALGEAVSVVGTPHALHYQSVRSPAFGRALDIPLSGPIVAAGLVAIKLRVEVAGQVFEQSFPPLPNQTYRFTWNGLDAYGRAVAGAQPYRVRIGYGAGFSRYAVPPWNPPTRSFGASGETGVDIVPGRALSFLFRQWRGRLGGLATGDARGQGLGGWTLSPHHVYDPIDRVLHLGSGGRRSAEAVALSVIETVAGHDYTGEELGDGGPAREAMLYSPWSMVAAPDGGFYIADTSNQRIRRVWPDGTIETIAGTGESGDLGDGGPATDAQLSYPTSVALAPDGSLYVADTSNDAIRRIDPAGIITTVAGGRRRFYGGVQDQVAPDGGPATAGYLDTPVAVAVGPDCSLYAVEWGTSAATMRLRKVTPDGRISTVAGGGAGDVRLGGFATSLRLRSPRGVAVGPDGSVYLSDADRVHRVTPDGMLQPVAGGGGRNPADGELATAVRFRRLQGLAVAADGSLFVADELDDRIWQVTPAGVLATLAGGASHAPNLGDGGPAPAAELFEPMDVTLGPDGSVYVADTSNDRIRRVRPAFPEATLGELFVPAEDGSVYYVFDPEGRHLRTLDARTGAVRYSFEYAAGRLSAITDGYGNSTIIERDGAGAPTAIVAPFGQRTTLTVDGDGYLQTLTNPAGELQSFTYLAAGGLLATSTDPLGGVHGFEYDELGRLLRDVDPTSSIRTLTRTETAAGYAVVFRTPLGRTTRYTVEQPSPGTERRVTVPPDGLSTSQVAAPTGTTTQLTPDGTTVTRTLGPDPRFGMLTPIVTKLTVRTPAPLTSTVTSVRTVTLLDPAVPLSLATLTDVTTVNGRPYRAVFDAATRTLTRTSPAGRTSEVTLDEQGRLVASAVPGFHPVSFTYDLAGRLEDVTQGTRTSHRTFGADGFLATLEDPLGRTVGLGRDLAGRVTTQTLPDARVIGFGYDAAGNLTSLTPPGGDEHGFGYDSLDLLASYDPPAPDAGAWATTHAYDADRQLDFTTEPDGSVVDPAYDPAGRLDTLTFPRGTVDVAYDAAGRVSVLTAPDLGRVIYAWDGFLPRGETWTGSVAGSVTRTYDTDFRLRTQSVNAGSTVTLNYDADKLLTSLTGAVALTVRRDATNGSMTGTTAGAVVTAQTFSGYGELDTWSATASAAPLYSFDLDQDDLGRITLKTETVQGVTVVSEYGYDLAGRLEDVWRDGVPAAHYDYDENGNRTGATEDGVTSTGTVDAQDRLLAFGATTFTYSRRGDLLSRTDASGTTGYATDTLGNLVAATLPDGTSLSYVIDASNRRIGKRRAGVLEQGFLYDGQLRLVAELNGANALVSRFVYGTRVNVPDLMVRGGVTYRILSDHLGSVRLVVRTSNGAVLQRLDYDEWGNVLADTNPGFQPFGFAGGLYDRDTRLVRFGARDYDPEIGRWISKDPIRFRAGDFNLYAYVASDPVNLFDPSGLKIWRVRFPCKENKGAGKDDPDRGWGGVELDDQAHTGEENRWGACAECYRKYDEWKEELPEGSNCMKSFKRACDDICNPHPGNVSRPDEGGMCLPG